MIIFINFKLLYYNASYDYQLYFRFAYFLDDYDGGGLVKANPYKILFCSNSILQPKMMGPQGSHPLA